MSHTTVLSALPARRYLPSGLNSTSPTAPPTPERTRTDAPVFASHTRAVPSVPHVATNVPSGLNATLRANPPWPINVSSFSPVEASQISVDPSIPAVAIRLPSGLTATAKVSSSSPGKVRTRSPVVASRTNVVPTGSSHMLATTRRPSGLKTAVQSAPGAEIFSWSFPLLVSHSRTAPAASDVTSLVPSGLKPTVIGDPVRCPGSVSNRRPVWPSQMTAVPSSLPVASREPSGENCTSHTRAR